MRTLSLGLSLLVLGCFGDSTPIGGGDGGSSTGAGCVAGQAGCACYPNHTCDAGFTCVVEADTCITEGCTSGEIGCTCVDGQCLGEAVCEGGVCNPPGGASASGGSTGAATSTASSVDETTAPGDGSSGSSSAGTSNGATSDADTGAMATCGGCFDDATMPAGACGDQAGACVNDPACAALYMCVSDCAHMDESDGCIDACCDQAGMPSAEFVAFAACIIGACGAPICPMPSCG